MDTPVSKRYFWQGTLPQITMIGLFLYSHIVYKQPPHSFGWYEIPSIFGHLLFVYCLLRLYVFGARSEKLLTTGVFKYTRHPMYTGLFFMNLHAWLPKPASDELLFFVSQGLFLLCLVVAAWFQEKETLARFGDEAVEYYERTPRLFFMYPFHNRG